MTVANGKKEFYFLSENQLKNLKQHIEKRFTSTSKKAQNFIARKKRNILIFNEFLNFFNNFIEVFVKKIRNTICLRKNVKR